MECLHSAPDPSLFVAVTRVFIELHTRSEDQRILIAIDSLEQVIDNEPQGSVVKARGGESLFVRETYDEITAWITASFASDEPEGEGASESLSPVASGGHLSGQFPPRAENAGPGAG